MLTAERLREVVSYDSDAGEFRWLAKTGSRAAGDLAGHLRPDGYRTIRIDRSPYLASRLAWLYVYGEFPPDLMDHINCNRSDDRIANLRPANRTQNRVNTGPRSTNTTGFRGVSYRARQKKWGAVIGINKRTVWLGTFDSPEAAHDAYQAAARREYGEYARFE